MKRYIDWTGSGNPIDPVNIAISIIYDKANQEDEDEYYDDDDYDYEPPPQSKSNSGCGCGGCLTSLFILVTMTIMAGFMLITI